ncbi:hypothetical protein Ngar_c08640 [Candidatus Nitrososphaera gargensis Ga9.2]|uniref:Uncharacterized protein n=1 Tax=Nitrososphaera gargensis (strain Ga9.2) TaxID=1237085 RepID=K0I929_NITGG|nr:hypothetical protein Ngar_c08640 [Candidatus Nitrososphaera gargensis Ga9.2]
MQIIFCTTCQAAAAAIIQNTGFQSSSSFKIEYSFSFFYSSSITSNKNTILKKDGRLISGAYTHSTNKRRSRQATSSDYGATFNTAPELTNEHLTT